jgi:hypothetical protein
MKTDQLEDFIRENRDQFDTLEPAPDMWGRIQKAQEKPTIKPWRSITAKAAAVAAIFMLGYLFSLWIGQQGSQELLTEEAVETTPEIIMFKEARIYYSSLISDREKQLFDLTADNKQLQEEIKEEFMQLDHSFKSLENDLTDQVAGEEILEAMIQHYRLKLDMLEDILSQIKSVDEMDKKEVRHVL